MSKATHPPRPSPEARPLNLRDKKRRGAGGLRFSSAQLPALGRPMRCCFRARARQADGADVAIGVVENAWAPRKPRRCCSKASKSCPASASNTKAPYAGGDGPRRPSSARRPQLALVDELAHTNAAPGSRHPKRYLDVEELLAAGIDVYATLNIQHVESLNDVIAQITRIRVRETVPELGARQRR